LRNWNYHPQDLWSGVLFIAISAAFLWAGARLEVGTANLMGPGFFPDMIAGSLGLVGAVLVVRGLIRRGEGLGTWGVRGMIGVTASLVVFGLAAHTLGLAISGLLAIFTSTLAAPKVRWVEALVVSVAAVAACCVVFVYGIGLNIPIWPDF
jgi:putative tricarboxylic transport membrane protein